MIHGRQLRDFEKRQKKAIHVVIGFHLGLRFLSSVYSEIGISLPLIVVNRTQQVT